MVKLQLASLPTVYSSFLISATRKHITDIFDRKRLYLSSKYTTRTFHWRLGADTMAIYNLFDFKNHVMTVIHK
jgi:hypothetical protein